jgi:hypothetical protein
VLDGTTSAGGCLTAERALGVRASHRTSASNGFHRAVLPGSVLVAAGGSTLSASDPVEVSRQTVRPLVVKRRNRCWDGVRRLVW